MVVVMIHLIFFHNFLVVVVVDKNVSHHVDLILLYHYVYN